jgi:hypothetical protein
MDSLRAIEVVRNKRAKQQLLDQAKLKYPAAATAALHSPSSSQQPAEPRLSQPISSKV